MNNSKLEKLSSFDPNGVGVSSNQIFGLPFSEEESKVILLPVPWAVTVSYGAGCDRGPLAIREASYQIDLHDPAFPEAWHHGIFMRDISEETFARSVELRVKADRYIQFLQEGGRLDASPEMQGYVREIDAGGEDLRKWVRTSAAALLTAGKMVGVVGGDHSTPLGFLDALATIHDDFGILQIDAHCDLRNAYEGFRYSHASIMWNALKLPQVRRLVQIGIRDLAKSEAELIEHSRGRIVTHFDAAIQEKLYAGSSWQAVCESLIQPLPEKVYISFDIDGLDPKLCPNTGTPVPGGLDFQQSAYLLREVVRSGRRIIGFDLSEVNPGTDEWDASVGARVLYKLCNLVLSQ